MSGAADMQPIKTTSLYVGDLHPMVSDAMLFAKFAEIGAVLNARVCRDMVSRDSLGYGYVNFRDPADAELAMENINFTLLYGRPFRLMWSQKDPSIRKSGKGNVFVKNLDKSILPVELYDTFEQFGAILSCKLAMDEKNNSRGFGFVHFEKEESAQRAISAVNGKKLKDRVVYVGPFIPKSERKATGSAAKFNNCYVKNFGDEIDDQKFHDMFAKFGSIKSACIMRNDQGESKGFGFVCFEEPTSAEAAVKELNGSEVGGKPIYVGRAQRKEERQEELKQRFEKQRTERQSRYATGVNLYVKNLDDAIDDGKLTEAFSKFGEITSAKVMRDANGQSRSFGFVCFRNAEHAAVAVTKMNTVMLGSKPLYVAIAQRKEDRKAKLTAEYQARMDQMRANMYPVHPGLSYLPNTAAAAAAAFPQRQGYYGNTLLGPRPRWQQPAPTGASQYMQGAQAAAAAAAGNTFNGQLSMQMRNQAAVSAGMGRPGAQAAALGQLMGGAGGSVRQAQQQQQQQQQVQQQQVQQAGGMVQSGQGAGGRGPVNMVGGPRPNMATVAGAAGMQQQMRGAAAAAAAGGQNVRYNQNARNVIHPQQQQQTVAAAGGGAAAASQAHQQQQQQIGQTEQEMTQRHQIGSRLYQFIDNLYPDMVGKLTGVMLTLSMREITELFDDEERLTAKVRETHKLLKEKAEAAEAGDATEKAAGKKQSGHAPLSRPSPSSQSLPPSSLFGKTKKNVFSFFLVFRYCCPIHLSLLYLLFLMLYIVRERFTHSHKTRPAIRAHFSFRWGSRKKRSKKDATCT